MIDKKVLEICHKHEFNGTLIIAKGDSIISQQAVGFADFEHGVKMSLNTKLRIASISKQITAFAILQFVHENKITLQTTLDTFFPEYNPGKAVTIHHLLSNTSGLPSFEIRGDYSHLSDEEDYYDAFTKQIILTKPLEFTPGEKFEYNGSSYLVLTSIIEKVSGLPFETYLKQNIFEPLQMNNSGFDFTGVELENRGTPYDVQDDKRIPAYVLDLRIGGGGGGLYSSALDLHKWMQALKNHTLLPKKNIDLMFTKHIPVIEGTWYGYGFFLEEEEIEKTLHKINYHTGGGPGVQSINSFFVNQDITMIMISNVNDKTKFHPPRVEIYQLLL